MLSNNSTYKCKILQVVQTHLPVSGVPEVVDEVQGELLLELPRLCVNPLRRLRLLQYTAQVDMDFRAPKKVAVSETSIPVYTGSFQF